MTRRTQRRPDGGSAGEIGIRDPFNLVRHLARSQSDPRKAVAELVQNALDEQATHVQVHRVREHGMSLLKVRDDGLGVLPGLPRPEALETIAKNIGHSRKRQMSFDERMRAAMLGQFGIGLLGFWSIGHELRMISRVADSEVWCLSLIEDSPKFEVYRMTGTAFPPGTWTEVQVCRIHAAAMNAVSAARLSAYLSMELRGQLIRHGTQLELRDAVTRKSSERYCLVKPAELAGEKLKLPSSLPVDGYKYPAELQLYYAGDDPDNALALKLAGGGAILIDDVREHPAFDSAPWNDRRLAGVIDFPHLEVPPGSRRGVVANDAFDKLLAALHGLASQVEEQLAEWERRESARVSATAQKQLNKWFGEAAQLVPHLDWFSLARPGRLGVEGEGAQGAPVPTLAPEVEASTDEAASDLFPPGPCHTLEFRPKKLQLALRESQRVKVLRRDDGGRLTPEGGTIRWSASGPITLVADESSTDVVTVHASETPGEGEVAASLEAKPDIEARLPVEVVLQTPTKSGSGIPSPEEVDDPQSTWRSRWTDQGWQINVGHPDARRLSTEPKAKLQYLAYLLAKEVIARNFARPELGAILEEMVGLLAALEASRNRPKKR